jgi:SagB-type dehydrogenase family enzyme
MKIAALIALCALLGVAQTDAIAGEGGEAMSAGTSPETIKLPGSKCEGKMTVEAALLARRSIRSYKDEPVTLEEIAQVLWAAQGVTRPGYRTAPSAGALYPLEVYIVAGRVTGLGPGVYRYDPQNHALSKRVGRDVRRELAEAALGQSMIASAPATVAICGVFERTTRKYGERGIRYVHMEVGHAGQNISLEAVSLNLGTVVVGAFRDEQVRKVLGLDASEQPLYLMPLGR